MQPHETQSVFWLRSQTTTVFRSIWQVWDFRSQNSVPLQRSPSSLLAQSAVLWHWQVITPDWQEPLLQTSPVVQPLPSSQVPPSVFTNAHFPVLSLHASTVHGLPSSHWGGLPGLHWPPLHTSPWVHKIPSSHPNPSTDALDAHLPLLGSHASIVQPLPSSQVVGVPDWQRLAAQISPTVHGLPSSQTTELLVNKQFPLAPSQASSVHGLPSLQTLIRPPTHRPSTQASPKVQPVPSSQLAPELAWAWHKPSATVQMSKVQGFPSSHTRPVPVHCPAKSQASLSVHGLPSLQAKPTWTILCKHKPSAQESLVQSLVSEQSLAKPVQSPPWQLSLFVQPSPSSQGPSWGKWLQVPSSLLQASEVQILLSSQGVAMPGRQVPSLQASPLVQPLPSEQGAVFRVCTQPLAASQVSSVQTSVSAQSTVEPPVQTPAVQTSPVVQALPSSQGPSTLR